MRMRDIRDMTEFHNKRKFSYSKRCVLKGI